MRFLSIDTSCDETSVAVTNNLKVESNAISTQIRYHKKYGGVVPFLAQRLHKERIDKVIEVALKRADCSWDAIEAIAVTQGPGLAPALEVGIAKAKELSQARGLPLYGVNHMAGHMAACFARIGTKERPLPTYPLLALLVSGGHTELIRVMQWGRYERIGETLDDALGEAYDKVAKMLGLGYPGGAVIARLAETGDPDRFDLPVPMAKNASCDFSYSGLKTAVRYLRESLPENMDAQTVRDLAASFERVAQESILQKVERALKRNPDTGSLLLAGGVASNTALRRKLRRLAGEYGLTLFTPPNRKLCTDNAAMIGLAAFLDVQAGAQPSGAETLDRKPALVLG